MVDKIGEGLQSALQQQARGQAEAAQEESNFEQLLKGTLEKTNKASLDSGEMADGLAAGEHRNIHETMIALQEANLSFRLVTQVRNKVVDAYREIFRMPV